MEKIASRSWPMAQVPDPTAQVLDPTAQVSTPGSTYNALFPQKRVIRPIDPGRITRKRAESALYVPMVIGPAL